MVESVPATVEKKRATRLPRFRVLCSENMLRAEPTIPAESRTPTRVSQAWLAFRIIALRTQRGALNLLHPVPRLKTDSGNSEVAVAAQNRSPLRTSTDPRERRLEDGKIQNLRTAA